MTGSSISSHARTSVRVPCSHERIKASARCVRSYIRRVLGHVFGMCLACAKHASSADASAACLLNAATSRWKTARSRGERAATLLVNLLMMITASRCYIVNPLPVNQEAGSGGDLSRSLRDEGSRMSLNSWAHSSKTSSRRLLAGTHAGIHLHTYVWARAGSWVRACMRTCPRALQSNDARGLPAPVHVLLAQPTAK